MMGRASNVERNPGGVPETGGCQCPGLAPSRVLHQDACMGWLHLKALRTGQPFTQPQSPLREPDSSMKAPLTSLYHVLKMESLCRRLFPDGTIGP